MDFDFYYGLQSQTFSFYRIPKLLFTDSRFSSLSAEAKTLYGILLDRMELSMKNGWFDKQNRVYLFFTVQEIQESLGCGKNKATGTEGNKGAVSKVSGGAESHGLYSCALCGTGQVSK